MAGICGLFIGHHQTCHLIRFFIRIVQYHTHVGRGNCTVVDTYWQTETGGHIATNFPGEFVLC